MQGSENRSDAVTFCLFTQICDQRPGEGGGKRQEESIITAAKA